MTGKKTTFLHILK